MKTLNAISSEHVLMSSYPVQQFVTATCSQYLAIFPLLLYLTHKPVANSQPEHYNRFRYKRIRENLPAGCLSPGGKP